MEVRKQLKWLTKKKIAEQIKQTVAALQLDSLVRF